MIRFRTLPTRSTVSPIREGVVGSHQSPSVHRIRVYDSETRKPFTRYGPNVSVRSKLEGSCLMVGERGGSRTGALSGRRTGKVFTVRVV